MNIGFRAEGEYSPIQNFTEGDFLFRGAHFNHTVPHSVFFKMIQEMISSSIENAISFRVAEVFSSMPNMSSTFTTALPFPSEKQPCSRCAEEIASLVEEVSRGRVTPAASKKKSSKGSKTRCVKKSDKSKNKMKLPSDKSLLKAHLCRYIGTCMKAFEEQIPRFWERYRNCTKYCLPYPLNKIWPAKDLKVIPECEKKVKGKKS